MTIILFIKSETNLHWGKVAVRVLWRHTAHGWINRRWWCRTVRSTCWAGVVLATTPAKADARVADRVALHLVDSHFGGVTLYELNETATLSWWDLDIGNLTKALKERAEFVLGNVARETTNKDSCVVWIGELVHRLRSLLARVKRHWWATHLMTVSHHRTTLHSSHWGTAALILVLWRCGGDTHWTVAAVDSLHLTKSALLVGFLGETNESIATGESTDGVGHDLCRLAGGKTLLENVDQNIFVDLRTEITNKDGVLGTTIVTARPVVSTRYGESHATIKVKRRQIMTQVWRIAYLRSARPPPEAQLSLNGRLEFGMSVPFN